MLKWYIMMVVILLNVLSFDWDIENELNLLFCLDIVKFKYMFENN